MEMTDKFEEGVKLDEGKNRYDLIDAYTLNELAKVYTYGTIKYEDHNWRKGMRFSRIFGAIMRHTWAFWKGEDIDPESGLPHMAHAAWGCFTLLNYSKYHKNLDDRFIEKESIVDLQDMKLNDVIDYLTERFNFCLNVEEKKGK
jgi:hypothetical protein